MNLKVLKIARMVASLLFLMHLLGCFWFYLALIGGYETTWISEYDEGSGLSASNEVKYIYSVCACTLALVDPDAPGPCAQIALSSAFCPLCVQIGLSRR